MDYYHHNLNRMLSFHRTHLIMNHIDQDNLHMFLDYSILHYYMADLPSMFRSSRYFRIHQAMTHSSFPMLHMLSVCNKHQLQHYMFYLMDICNHDELHHIGQKPSYL
jgi:hypothetical protein